MPLGMLGKYEKLDVLGHGASGIVYLAKDTLLNRQVAIKVVNVQAGDVQHFLEEARVLDRLRHPNIVRVHNVDRIDGNIVLDMEYVRGKNVQEMLREQGALPEEYALEIAAQTLDALQYAHEMQTVHRDIKPANILISRQGEVKLVDFGLAEILATNAYAGGAGTYAYMAPEDFAEENRSDHQSDIWAVGVTLYEMLSGRRPFLVSKTKDPFAWKRVLDNEQPTPLNAYLPAASPDLQSIVSRALAREKSRRYATAAAFRDDVKRLQSGLEIARPAAYPDPDPSSRRSSVSSGTISPQTSGRQRIAMPANGATRSVGEGARGMSQSGLRAGSLSSAADALPLETVRQTLPPRQASGNLSVSPGSIDFGPVRRNETREVRVQVVARGVQGAAAGKITHCPGWLTAHPMAFDRPKQVLTLAANAAVAADSGETAGIVRVEMAGEATDIPVSIAVAPARPTFVQISAWFVPLFAAALLPVAAVLYASAGSHASPELMAGYVPAAAAASGLLTMMLLLISFAADTGMAERVACGVVSAAMGAVLGVTSAHWQPGVFSPAMIRTLLTGVPLGGMLFLQLLSLRRWTWWALVTACTGLAIGGGFFYQLK